MSIRIPHRQSLPLASAITPIVDVVFILLIFFLLISKSADLGELNMSTPSQSELADTPRLLEVGPDMLRLNGTAIARSELIAQVAQLLAASPGAIVIRPLRGSTVQNLVDVLDTLTNHGIRNFTVIK